MFIDVPQHVVDGYDVQLLGSTCARNEALPELSRRAQTLSRPRRQVSTTASHESQYSRDGLDGVAAAMSKAVATTTSHDAHRRS